MYIQMLWVKLLKPTSLHIITRLYLLIIATKYEKQYIIMVTLGIEFYAETFVGVGHGLGLGTFGLA